MERTWLAREILATKILHISRIMIYFGYAHECAELYLQLCKDSRCEWNNNIRNIIKAIMRHKNSRKSIMLQDEFSEKHVKFLNLNKNYNYYQIGVKVK